MYITNIFTMAAFVWGFGKLGQLGNGQTDTEHTPVRPKLLTHTEVCDVQCGGYYTVLLSKDGRLFSFGCGKYGRLGTGDEEDRKIPVKIKVQDVLIEKVSCGIWHGAAVSTTKELYIWGYGRSHGVLGDASIQSAGLPCLLKGPFNTKIVGISCGNNFTLLWTEDGDAYSWGCGRHGVLGHGNCEDKNQPTVISYFKDHGIKVKFMDAGFAHCGAVTEQGQVFMFGKNKDGALGIGNHTTTVVSIPKVVDSLTNTCIQELSCSVGEKHGHTLFVSREGEVFASGDGYKGKLGFGDQEPRWVASPLPTGSFNNEQISHVCAGGIHSAAVSKDGQVYTWGCGSDGRLGHPDGKGHRYLFRSDVPRMVEGLNQYGQALKISSSYYHTATIVEKV